MLEAVTGAPVDAQEPREERAIEHAIDVRRHTRARSQRPLVEPKPEERGMTQHALGVRLVFAEVAQQGRDTTIDHGLARPRDEVGGARAFAEHVMTFFGGHEPALVDPCANGFDEHERRLVELQRERGRDVRRHVAGSLEERDAIGGRQRREHLELRAGVRRLEEPLADGGMLGRAAAQRSDDEHARALLFEQLHHELHRAVARPRDVVEPQVDSVNARRREHGHRREARGGLGVERALPGNEPLVDRAEVDVGLRQRVSHFQRDSSESATVGSGAPRRRVIPARTPTFTFAIVSSKLAAAPIIEPVRSISANP